MLRIALTLVVGSALLGQISSAENPTPPAAQPPTAQAPTTPTTNSETTNGQRFSRASELKAPSETKPAERKLTTTQTRGLRLLQSAEAEASALQPDMRAFILWKVAEGYRAIDPAKANALLKKAFLASVEIEDIAPEFGDKCYEGFQGCGIKLWLERETLSAINSLPDTESLLPQARPHVQQQVMSSLIKRYVAKGNLQRARELISTLADQGNYPYSAAMDLMAALPRTANSERAAIFSEALNAYRAQGESTSYSTSYDGLPGMVMRHWKDMPPELTEDAIDQILAAAKDLPDSPKLTISGAPGTVAISSQYEYRLFQLLPILEQLDKPKAEGLLRDDPSMAAMIDRFPQGYQTLVPDSRSHPAKDGQASPVSLTISIANTPPVAVNALAVEAQAMIRRKKQQAAADAETDARQAIAEAMSLPENMPSNAPGRDEVSSPRAEALLEIAKKVGKRNPSAAKDALAAARNSLSQASLLNQARTVNDVAEQYVDLGDNDGADNTIKEALQIAEKLYAKDSDPTDTNLAFKGAWPSSNEWRHCVQIAARFSPTRAEEIIAGIRDPEIATFEKVYFADALLGIPFSPMLTGVSKKDEHSNSSF